MRPRMGITFRGRDRKAVDAALDALEAAQAKEQEGLQAVMAAELARRERLEQRIAFLSERIAEQEAAEQKLRELFEQARATGAVFTEAMAPYLRELDAEAGRKRQPLLSRLNAAKNLVMESLTAFEEVLTQGERLAAAPAPESGESNVAGAAGSGGRVLPFRPAVREDGPAATFLNRRRDPTLAATHWRPGTVALESEAPPAPRPQTTLPAAVAGVPLRPPAAPTEAASKSVEQAGTLPHNDEVNHDDEVNDSLRARLQTDVMRFLEGKVVGADLHLPGGRLLAAHGTPITPELAQRAETEGVLSDLILHMTWPEGKSG